MSKDIVVPETLAQAKLKWKTPQDEVDYWKQHPKTRMPVKMWDEYYCSSILHRGLCCSSCLGEEEYLGQPNFDDKCCCRAVILEQPK
jgi:hypothetical protein